MSKALIEKLYADYYKTQQITLAEYLIGKDQFNPEVVDQISIYFAQQDDRWYCSDCLEDGGCDMPTTNPCPTGCGRCYCDDCKTKREETCLCGGDLN